MNSITEFLLSKTDKDRIAQLERDLASARAAQIAAQVEVGKWRSDFDAARAEAARLREALSSIARNTCCYRCQEAALVAKAALEGER